MATGKFTLEISEAFDRLSVLKVKFYKCRLDIKKREEILEQIESLESEVSISIGRDLGAKIYQSPEHKELYNINLQLFDIIDKVALEDGIDAKIPFNLNNARFQAKNNLQKKFFGKDTAEIKLL